MRALDHRYWPIWVAIVFLILAAGINSQTQTVPNWLTYSAIVASWIAGGSISRGIAPSAGGGFASALVLSFAGLLVLLPFWANDVMGAGCVKANMALGGWIGCAVCAERGAKWLAGCVVAGGVLTAFSVWTFQLYGMNISALAQVFPAQAALSAGSVLTLVAMLRLAANETDKQAAEHTVSNHLPAA
jgi:Flp pilus assembly protein protease CpaA